MVDLLGAADGSDGISRPIAVGRIPKVGTCTKFRGVNA